VPQLKAVGLIDEAGRPTDVAHEWRDDQTYAQVARAMLAKLYPQGLLDAFPPLGPDRAGVEGWFSRNVKVGTGAARKMASFYLLLCKADPNEQNGEPKRERPQPAKRARAQIEERAPRAAAKPKAEQRNGEIFAAMAKHLYNR
jgi:hypothetical protein